MLSFKEILRGMGLKSPLRPRSDRVRSASAGSPDSKGAPEDRGFLGDGPDPDGPVDQGWREFLPAKRRFPARVRKIGKIAANRDGKKILACGPTSRFGEIFYEGPAAIWRKGGRPRLAAPYADVAYSGQPRFEWVMDPEQDGVFSIVVMVDLGSSKSMYRFFCGRETSLDLAGFGLRLMAGPAKGWAVFHPADGGPARYSQPRMFRIEGDAESEPAEGIVLPGSGRWSSLEREFENNLKNLDYEQNRALRLEELARGETVLLSAPKRVQISLGHRCNINCIMCNTGRTPDFTTVPGPVMRGLPSLFPFLDNFYVQGGEPLIYDELGPILEQSLDHPNMLVSLATNGARLMHGWIETILSGRFNLNISIDAARKETYEHIRRRARWDNLCAALARIRDERRGVYPRLTLCFCTMRSNYRQILDFIDFAHEYGASNVYFNLMEPNCLEEENKREYILDDPKACREAAAYIRAAYHKGAGLKVGVNDKVLGWILPKYPELVLDEPELAILPLSLRDKVRASLGQNRDKDERFWKKAGGSPLERERKEAGGAAVVGPVKEKEEPVSAPADRPDLPKGFFCTIPYNNFNIDVENTFACCHAHPPYNYITYGRVNSLFDLRNHPLLQKARREMRQGRAAHSVCHTRCPAYRLGGYKEI